MTPADRKQEILEAAQELFQTQGYSGFSYQDLSSRLGIAKPSIHHHFPTKEALGVALVESYGEMLAGMQAQLEAASSSPADQLRAMLQMGEEEACCHDRALCPGGALHSNFENFPASVQEATREVSERMHRFVADLLRRGRELGEIRFLGTPEDEAWTLMSTLMGSRQQCRTHGVEVWRAVARQVAANLLGSP